MKQEWLDAVALLFVGVGAVLDYKNKMIPLLLPVGGIMVAFIMQLCMKASIVEIGLGFIPGFIFLLISFVSSQKIGYGDGLIICLLGTFLGVWMSTMITMIALLFSCFFLLILFVLKRVKITDEIPFLPFLLLGFVCGIGVVA